MCPTSTHQSRSRPLKRRVSLSLWLCRAKALPRRPPRLSVNFEGPTNDNFGTSRAAETLSVQTSAIAARVLRQQTWGQRRKGIRGEAARHTVFPNVRKCLDTARPVAPTLTLDLLKF